MEILYLKNKEEYLNDKELHLKSIKKYLYSFDVPQVQVTKNIHFPIIEQQTINNKFIKFINNYDNFIRNDDLKYFIFHYFDYTDILNIEYQLISFEKVKCSINILKLIKNYHRELCNKKDNTYPSIIKIFNTIIKHNISFTNLIISQYKCLHYIKNHLKFPDEIAQLIYEYIINDKSYNIKKFSNYNILFN